MSHFVLILLSKKNISLYYDGDASSSYLCRYDDGSSYGSDYWTPWVAVETESGLQVGTDFAYKQCLRRAPNAYADILSVAKQLEGSFNSGGSHPMSDLPFVTVEAYLRQFFLDVYRSEDYLSLKKDLPVGLLYCSDVEMEERSRLLDAFGENGYGNVTNLDFDASLLDVLREQRHLQTPYSCVLANDGQNILMGVYISQTAERLATGVAPDLGRDPRVDYGVKLLWESMDTHGLSLENERPILANVVKQFLDNESKARLNETIVLSDNKEYDAYLLKNNIVEAALANDQLSFRINNFLKKNDVDSSKVGVVYREFSGRNDLLEASVSPFFNPAVKVTDLLLRDVLSLIWQAAKRVRLEMSSIGNRTASNAEAVRAWVRHADAIRTMLDQTEVATAKADTMLKPFVEDLKRVEAKWLDSLKKADFKGAKLNLQMNVSPDLGLIAAELDERKREMDNHFTTVQTIAVVEDAKPLVARYNDVLKHVESLHNTVDEAGQFVSRKIAETDHFESLYPEYQKTLEALRKTSVKSLQERLIEKIKTLVPKGFELPVVQASKVKVKLSAELVTSGFLFAKKSKLIVQVDFGEASVPFRCVLAFFTDMVVKVDRTRAFVVDLNEKGEPLSGVVRKEFDLPLPEREMCKKKGELTIKLWPHEEELVGINSAFEGNGCSLMIK